MKNKKMLSMFRSEDGASALEFAMIAPIVLLFTVGVIEISLMMLTQNIMESATFVASRLGKTGYIEANMSREDTIKKALEDSADGLLDPGRVHIDKLSYDEFGDIGMPEPFVDANGNGDRDNGENYTDINGNSKYDKDMGAASAGGAGEIVVYVVTYAWKVTTPIMNAILGDEHGEYKLTARTVVKNEPF